MRNAGTRDPYLLGSLRKGLEVIDCFARAESWSLAELAVELGQSKPTTFRILHTLEDFGFLQKEATGRYRLGLRFHALGSAAMRQEQLRWQALPPLQDLAEATGETVHVGILHEGEVVCVQAVEGTRLVRMHATIGKRTPAHASAMGKVLLAMAGEPVLERFLRGRRLARFTAATITEAARFRAACAEIRGRGYALDAEEIELGLRCIGVPVGAGAALALSAPAGRMDAARIEALVPLLQAAAARIAAMLTSDAARSAA